MRINKQPLNLETQVEELKRQMRELEKRVNLTFD